MASGIPWNLTRQRASRRLPGPLSTGSWRSTCPRVRRQRPDLLHRGAEKPRSSTRRGGRSPTFCASTRDGLFSSLPWAGPRCSARAHIFIGVNAVRLFRLPRLQAGIHPRLRGDGQPSHERRAWRGGGSLSHTPLIQLTKAEIILRGAALGFVYGMTHSCYDPSPDGAACGACDSCLIRRKGFREPGSRTRRATRRTPASADDRRRHLSAKVVVHAGLSPL